MTQKKNSESQDSCRQWQQMLLFEPLPKLDDAKAISNAQRSSTAQSRRSERNFRTTSVHRQIVTVNDSGRAIGEDHVNAIYLNSDVENARQLRAHNAQEPDWRSKNFMGLLLFGNYGTGKTHLAYSILKELDRQGLPGYYITIPDLFDRISDRVNRIDVADVLGKLCMVSCLVLDEIGVQSGDADEKKRLYQIIDGRIKNGRPTILVTNLDRSELVNLLTERVVSRVIQSSYKLFFTGRCRREPTRRSAEEVF